LTAKPLSETRTFGRAQHNCIRIFLAHVLLLFVLAIALIARLPPNKSLDASGGGVFRIMIGPAMLE
jgi:hypothetical protein